MRLVFHTWAFDDVITFEYLKKLKFGYPKNEKSYWSEIKIIIFSFSQVLSFRLKEQTSKNVAKNNLYASNKLI